MLFYQFIVSEFTNLITFLVIIGAYPFYVYGRKLINKWNENRPNCIPNNYSNRSKYPNVDLNRLRSTIMLFSFVLSFSFVLLAFNITSKTPQYSNAVSEGEIEMVELVIPRTEHKKEIVEIPKEIKETQKTLIDKIELVDDLPELIDSKIEVNNNVIESDISTIQNNVPPKSKPLPLPKIEDEAPMIIVEEMPRFPGCEHLTDQTRKTQLCQPTTVEIHI